MTVSIDFSEREAQSLSYVLKWHATVYPRDAEIVQLAQKVRERLINASRESHGLPPLSQVLDSIGTIRKTAAEGLEKHDVICSTPEGMRKL